MIVRTSYVNVNGTPKVRVRGHGRQYTHLWDPAKSTDWNHGTAAGGFFLAKGAAITSATVEQVVAAIDAGKAHHDSNDAGTKHGFEF